MQLRDEDVREFQELYKKRFGREISKEKAFEQALKLLRLVQLVYRPMTREQFAAIEKQEAEIILSKMIEAIRRDREQGISNN